MSCVHIQIKQYQSINALLNKTKSTDITVSLAVGIRSYRATLGTGRKNPLFMVVDSHSFLGRVGETHEGREMTFSIFCYTTPGAPVMAFYMNGKSLEFGKACIHIKQSTVLEIYLCLVCYTFKRTNVFCNCCEQNISSYFPVRITKAN